ncbi:MAG: DUF3237 domain-containing protein, partial [Solirubrobacterales bacterium]|nr:DUF3237 domain-containing protein [Solirubrobacterales bacterium]
MGLEFEFEYHAMLKPPVEIGPCPYGTRRFYEAVGGEVTGERISGRVLSGGGDWILIGPDGWGRLDVRAQIHRRVCPHVSRPCPRRPQLRACVRPRRRRLRPPQLRHLTGHPPRSDPTNGRRTPPRTTSRLWLVLGDARSAPNRRRALAPDR